MHAFCGARAVLPPGRLAVLSLPMVYAAPAAWFPPPHAPPGAGQNPQLSPRAPSFAAPRASTGVPSSGVASQPMPVRMQGPPASGSQVSDQAISVGASAGDDMRGEAANKVPPHKAGVGSENAFVKDGTAALSSTDVAQRSEAAAAQGSQGASGLPLLPLAATGAVLVAGTAVFPL